MESSKFLGKKPIKSGIAIDYDKTRKSIVIRISDPETLFPCYIEDPDAGTYKIIKTINGKLQMNK